MPYSVAERMCMVDIQLKYRTYAKRKKAFSKLFPKAEVPSKLTFHRWVKAWRENGSVQTERRPRDRSVLTDQKLADIRELLRKNPRISKRRLSAQAGISVTTAFNATRILKLRANEESAVNDLRVDDTQLNDFFGTLLSDFNDSEEEEKTEESGHDSFSSVWVKVEKDDLDKDPLTDATSTCTEDSLLTCNLVQSSQETKEYVQETSPNAGEKGLLGLFKSNKSCNVCGRIFRNQHKMRNHMCKDRMIHTQEKPYACKFCNKAFARKNHIIEHLRTHTGKRSDHCRLCDMNFKSKSDKKQHMVLHKEKPIHVCEICGKSFALKRHLNIHKKTHTEGKPYFCEICNRYFSHKKNMRKHLESHNAVNASEHFETYCDDNCLQRRKRRMSSNEIDSSVVVNDSASDSIIQMELIAQEYMYRQANKLLKENSEETDEAQDSLNMASRKTCEFNVDVEKEKTDESGQDRNFSAVWVKVEKDRSELSISDHDPFREASTNYKSDSLHTCEMEKPSREAEKIGHQDSLDAGDKSVRGMLQSDTSCSWDVYGKTFIKPYVMRRHRMIHTQERPYACKLCNKEFARKDWLKEHLEIHTRDRPYHCGFCNRSYSTLRDMKKHMTVHNENTINVCNICGKSFTSKRCLNMHKKTHARGNLYCEICNKCFSSKKNMRKHLQSHHAVKASEECDDNNYLQRHKKRMISNEMKDSVVCNEVVGDSDELAFRIIHSEGTVRVKKLVSTLQGQGRKHLKENSEEIGETHESSNMASGNVLDEFYVGVEEHEFRECAEEKEFSEIPLMAEKENNPLATPDRNPLPVASTDCSQDFAFTGISGELNVKVKEEKTDQPEEEMEFSEVRVKVEKEDCLLNSDQCPTPFN